MLAVDVDWMDEVLSVEECPGRGLDALFQDSQQRHRGTSTGKVLVLKDYGQVKIFRTTKADGGVQYWTTHDLWMDSKRREELEPWMGHWGPPPGNQPALVV